MATAGDVTTGYSKQFGDNVSLLSQQTFSRFSPAVDVESGIKGEIAFWDQVGETEGQDVNTRFGDSPNNDVDEFRRSAIPQKKDWGKLYDDLDDAQRLSDPTNAYTRSAAAWLGREKDLSLITAATGTSQTGKAGGTATVLPASQKVAVDLSGSSEGLTVEKLIEARSKFGLADVDLDNPDNKPYFAYTQKQLDDLLAITKVTSADFATVKALVAGEIDTYMGFTFIKTQLLTLNLSTDVRTCFAFAKSGLKLGIWQDIQSWIERRLDKKGMWYAYYSMQIGATRMEEEKVVQVLCDESP